MGFLIPAVLTAVIESVYLLAAGYRGKLFFLLVWVVNIMTNSALNLILGAFGTSAAGLAALEAAATASEALCYCRALGYERRHVAHTAAANAVSFLFGAAVFGLPR